MKMVIIKVVGEGDKAIITCTMQANKDIKDSIEIEVVECCITENKVIVLILIIFQH